MSEREELLEEIGALGTRKATFAHLAALAASTDQFVLCQHYNLLWDAASDEIGRLERRLDDLDNECDAMRARRRYPLLGFLDTWAMWPPPGAS